jgi:hypothetical protein
VPVAGTPVLEYLPETITLNDCHVSRLGQPLVFTPTQLGAIPLTNARGDLDGHDPHRASRALMLGWSWLE